MTDIEREREEMARSLGMYTDWMPLGTWSSGYAELVWRLPGGDMYGATLPPFENARISSDTFEAWKARCKLVLERDVSAGPYRISTTRR